MTDIAKAIQAIGEDNDTTYQFSYSGEPSTQAEFESAVKFYNTDGSEMATQPVTWSAVSAKQTALQTEYDNNQYQRDRKVEFDKKTAGEQFDMMYHDEVDGTTTWKDWVAGIKSAHPKPSE